MWTLSVVGFALLDALLLYRPSSLMSPGSADSCSAMDSLGSRGRGSVTCVGKPLMASSVPDHCTASLLSIMPVTEMSENEAVALQDCPALCSHPQPAVEHSHPQEPAGRSLQSSVS